MVRADERRLRQILINLIGNAVRFTRTGNVILRVDQVQDRPNIGSGSTPRIRFEVQDTGMGIHPWQAEIFFTL
jgi:signal transduction histidine kinase